MADSIKEMLLEAADEKFEEASGYVETAIGLTILELGTRGLLRTSKEVDPDELLATIKDKVKATVTAKALENLGI